MAPYPTSNLSSGSLQEVPGSPTALEQQLNSLMDGHERRISHSLYDPVEGLDNIASPRTNVVRRIGKFPMDTGLTHFV